jgi:hypothetical protein
VDLELNLTREQDWKNLAKYYQKKDGFHWELAWLNLLEIKNFDQSIKEFEKVYRASNFDEASYIMLSWLGAKPTAKPKHLPASLKLYEAYESKDLKLLFQFLHDSSENEKYLTAIVERSIDQITEREIALIEKFKRSARVSYLLGHHCDQKLKNNVYAHRFYAEFYNDPWTKRVIEENDRYLFADKEKLQLRNAYAQKDRGAIKRNLDMLVRKLAEMEPDSIPMIWRAALEKALLWDCEHITQNLMGHAFWQDVSLSPQAIELMRDEMFSPELSQEPPFFTHWKKFFYANDPSLPPVHLDPDSLPLWKIRVEVNNQELSEALLKFPSDERFLFLWSVEKGASITTDNKRRWPENVKESRVVRENLERAFEKSGDKILWFERLRESGCSQSFYEYAIQKVTVPMEWVLSDLSDQLIRPTPVVRSFLKEKLSVTEGASSRKNSLKSKSFLEALKFLTPNEMQEVLVSRFIIEKIPAGALNDELIDLLWDARQKVGDETSRRWTKSVLSFLKDKPKASLKDKHWKWIEQGWEVDKKSLDYFSPTVFDQVDDFPWDVYMEKLQTKSLTEPFLNTLRILPTDRLKEVWIRKALVARIDDDRVLTAIKLLKTDFSKYSLLSSWYERKADFKKAIEYQELEFENSPILNDQIPTAQSLLYSYKKLIDQGDMSYADSAVKMAEFLESNGGVDIEVCAQLSAIFESAQKWRLAWKWVVQEWIRSEDWQMEPLLDRFLDIAFRGRIIEDSQRFLLDFIFQKGRPNRLTYNIFNILLGKGSAFHIRHLRKELIEKASAIFPLHPEVLKVRAINDYRAALLWKCFYHGELEQEAPLPAIEKKRKFSLFGLTSTVTEVDKVSAFTRYLNVLPLKEKVSAKHDFYDHASRTLQRGRKLYKFKKKVKLRLVDDLDMPLRLSFESYTIEVNTKFFSNLDEETWAAISVGFLQVMNDREKGLYEEMRLVERFFQGMLLSGSPIAKIIRLWVWLAISESLIEPTLLSKDPETLIHNLPFVNSLLIFYLSSDFEEKTKECGLLPS